ncbi:ABC-2 family transporter protein [Bacteriovorax sp. PP10]|uniref:ABC-2 family transporter protein n=1 Tax=Bacteriovorax antarcticus TaxID=3088717 RepID=A0ABU5VWQ7_9BACT|nr:ABC-2 family transporter protein [Bacteriovorax sp. PP10]MEA9357406.1 ABC-2 family transporter protein [Bacteriovorax sp. PP10]
MIKTIKKYILLYIAMFKASFIADLEYRANFFTRIMTDILWYIAQIMTFEVIYQHTQTIGDWNKYQMRVFLGLLFVIDAIYMIIIHENLENISEKVRKGDLDLLLAKPVDSQFMLTLQKANTAIFGNLILALSWLFYALHGLEGFNYYRLLWLVILIPCSLMVVYSIRFMFSATAVIFTRSENLQFLWWQIYKLGMRPDSMYNPYMKMVVLTALPVGVIISIPARALLNPPELTYLLWPLILAPMLVYGTHRFWNFALKFYSSASS